MRSIVLMTALMVLVPHAFACEIRLRVSDVPPHYYVNESGKWDGLSVNLAKALLHEAGCKITFVKLPWRRALESMKSGDIDM